MSFLSKIINPAILSYVVPFFIILIPAHAIIEEYMRRHSYYYNMMEWGGGTSLVFRGFLLCFSICFAIFLLQKRKAIASVLLLYIGLLIFGIIFLSIKSSEPFIGNGVDSLVRQGSGSLIINLSLISAIFLFFTLGIVQIGKLAIFKALKLHKTDRTHIGIRFITGLGLFLSIIIMLIVLQLFNTVAMRVITIGLLSAILLGNFGETYKIVESSMHSFSLRHRSSWIILIVCSLAILYCYFGTMYAIIPYPTARDANHAYMFYPKMRSLNGGYFRDTDSMRTTLFFRYGYITYFFSLGYGINSLINLSPDAIAIISNFRSGIFLLVLSALVFHEFIKIIRTKLNIGQTVMLTSTGLLLILLWLTSGTGAFLVFVDNKTDFGVLTFVLTAILSGLLFIRSFYEKEPFSILSRYSIISGVLFAMAVMAKQTAMFDVIGFVVAMITVLFSKILGVGFAILAIGILGLYGPVPYRTNLDEITLSFLVIVGIVTIAVGLFYSNWHKGETIYEGIKYGIIRLGGFALCLIVVKTPYLIMQYNTIGIKANEREILSYYALNTGLPSPENESLLFSEGLSEVYGSSGTEDFGRYIGFGSKIFYNSRWAQLAGNSDNKIFGEENFSSLREPTQKDSYKKRNSFDAYIIDLIGEKYLDSYRFNRFLNKDIPNQTSEFLQATTSLDKYYATRSGIFEYLNGNTSPQYRQAEYNLALEKARQTGNIQDVASNYIIWKTITFLQNNNTKKLIADEPISVTVTNIPYENLIMIPFNMVFNRSLQNPSSYYTDIGYVRLFVIILTVLSILYGVYFAIKTKKNIYLAVPLAAIITRSGWLLLGRGVVWYGMGMIIRSIISVLMVLYLMVYHFEENKKNFFLGIACGGVALLFVPQLYFNLIRIATYQSSGPFLRYKQSTGLNREAIYDSSNNEQIASILGLDTQDITWTVKNLIYNTLKSLPARRNTITAEGNTRSIQEINQAIEILQNQGSTAASTILTVLENANIPQTQRLPLLGQELSSTLEQSTYANANELRQFFIKYEYDENELFKLQFQHYEPILAYTNNRNDNEGIFIAGTYIRYFINDQQYTVYDQFMNRIRVRFSDQDYEKILQRLDEKNISMIILDPNIGSVVQGEGNKSLFERYFAQIEQNGSDIVQNGVLTTLLELYKNGSIAYYHSNNLGLKYAFTMSDSEIESLLGQGSLSNEQLMIIRQEMSIMRYCLSGSTFSEFCRWDGGSQEILTLMLQHIKNRIESRDFITDIADLRGVILPERSPNELLENRKSLSPQVAKIIYEFIQIESNPSSFVVQNFFLNSLTEQSQIFAVRTV